MKYTVYIPKEEKKKKINITNEQHCDNLSQSYFINVSI